jgi:hypothetical protein
MNMSGTQVFICRADTDGGVTDYVTLIPPETFFARGLCPEAVVGVVSRPVESIERITTDVFSRNRVFVDFMHDVIARNAPDDPSFQAAARRQQDGYIYIIDQRTPDPAGTVPPEDIVGAFKIVNGLADRESYWRNPKHVILSSSNGFFNLGPNLQKGLLEELAACCTEH